MRKIRNHMIHTNNPAALFAAGVESIIADPLYNPSKFDQHETTEMTQAARKQDTRGNLFGALLKQFTKF